MGHPAWEPIYTCRDDKFLLAQYLVQSDRCRFKLVATLGESNGDTIIKNVIFYFGESKMKINLKLGGDGTNTKLRVPRTEVRSGSSAAFLYARIKRSVHALSLFVFL